MELSAYERGVVVGLIIGEGSFTGDARKASLAISMHVRHRELLEWLADRVPASRLYGPYHHSGRHFMRWMLRGRGLADFVDEIEPDIQALCPHVASRIAEMRNRYGLTMQTPAR